MPFVPNEGQRELINKLGTFLLDNTEGKLFILRGYAGTGKTSVISALVRTLRSLGQKCILLAPTGRAAKVLSRYSSDDERIPAYTMKLPMGTEPSVVSHQDSDVRKIVRGDQILIIRHGHIYNLAGQRIE